jgi:hypothetical protein
MDLITTPAWMQVGLIIALNLISHFIIDALAKVTYHPPNREPGRFWLYWHLFVFGFGFFLILLYVQVYWMGIVAATFVDLWDWYFLRNYANRTSQPDWGKRYYLHPIADKIRGTLLSKVPNLNHSKVGVVPESLLYIGWLLVFIITV